MYNSKLLYFYITISVVIIKIHDITCEVIIILLVEIVCLYCLFQEEETSEGLSFITNRDFIVGLIFTTLQRENALFILNTSANILYASNRYTPNQDTYIDEVLNESVHCS